MRAVCVQKLAPCASAEMTVDPGGKSATGSVWLVHMERLQLNGGRRDLGLPTFLHCIVYHHDLEQVPHLGLWHSADSRHDEVVPDC